MGIFTDEKQNFQQPPQLTVSISETVIITKTLCSSVHIFELHVVHETLSFIWRLALSNSMSFYGWPQ